MESTDSDLSEWECRKFGKINLRSPPMVHYDDDDSSNSDNPHLKRRNSGREPKTTKTDTLHFNKENIPTNWNNSLTSRDSALGGSLISAYGSALTDSSDFDGQSTSESEAPSSPTHSTYGRYRKIYGSGSDSTTEQSLSNDLEEIVVLHRLPGENLGMILGIEGDKTKNHISTVRVKSVTIGGAAYRATGSSSGIAVGDEILEVNGLNLKTLAHDECVTVFKEMPLRVILKIRRKKSKDFRSTGNTVGSISKGTKNSFVKRFSMSESEDDSLDGFVPHQFEIDKNPKESLGLSIVPSYGTTRSYYQIKRILPSGAASRSQKLKAGDRLVSCNGISLCGINQAKCLSILKKEANNGDFEICILRPLENDTPTEFSLTVSNGSHNESNLVLKSPQLNKQFSDNPFDTESEPEVVLNSIQNFDNLFAENTVKLSYQKPIRQPSQQTSYSSDTSTDLDSSFEKELNRKKKKSSKMSNEEWGFALPPPVEFSDNPENDDEIPDTSIHDVLNDYSPTCSNMSTPIHQPVPPESTKMIEDLVGLEDESDVTSEFPLTQIEESPMEQTNNQYVENGYTKEDGSSHEVVDNYLRSQQEEDKNVIHANGDLSSEQTEIINSGKQHDKKAEKKSKNYFNLVGKVHQFYYSSSDTMSQNESGDDDLIQPVRIKKELSVPEYFKENGKDEVNIVDEDTIAPAIIQRNNKLPVSTRFDVDSFVKKEDKHEDFPHPMKSDSPPLPIMKQVKPERSLPPTRVDYQGEEIVETFTPVKAKKEEYSNILEEKLGKGIQEETIVPSEVKRETSFSGNVQLVMMTNKWANAKKDKPSNDLTFSGKIPEIKQLKKDIDQSKMTISNDNNPTETLSKGEELNTNMAVKTDNEKEMMINDTKTQSLENIGCAIAKMVVENSLNEIKKQANANDHNSENNDIKTEIKPQIIEKPEQNNDSKNLKTEITVKAQLVEQPEQRLEEPEKKLSSKNPEELKTDAAVHKTSVTVTTSHSILGTVHSKSSPTSPTIKPLSSVKPLSFNSLSLNRPTRYTTTINTGSKPSLLSTIYSKTHAVSSNVRSEEEPFLVSVMKGILGLGMKVEVKPEGYVQVTEIQPSGPVGKDGNIRVGDYILSINSTELSGLPDHKVQQILRLLPRGLAKLVVSVTPPDIVKIDNSVSNSRPPDLSINTSHTQPRRLTPALSPKSTGEKIPSFGSSYSSSPTSAKPMSPGMSPKSSPRITSPLGSKPLSPKLSPTNQQSPTTLSPSSPKPLAPALSPRHVGAHTTNKPVIKPRQTVTHDAKEPVVQQEAEKPPISPRRPIEEIMTTISVSSTKKEAPPVAPKPAPPVAPKPKPRSLPQQTETATHHKITPSIGGYVSSAQLKHSQILSQSEKEPAIVAHHTDYVSSARKADHDVNNKEPIDTVIFASIPSSKKTDYVSSARKTFEEPKLIPSGIVDYVSKERPKVTSRTKPASFQVLPPTGSSDGGVKIAPVRLNSALSPRKSPKGSDKSFNFNANYSLEEKALPRAGYFVGKLDVVTSPSKDVTTSFEEEVSIPSVLSPRSEGDNSFSPRSEDSQIDVVACSSDTSVTSSFESKNVQDVENSLNDDNDQGKTEERLENSIDEHQLSSESENNKQIIHEQAFGVGHEAKLVNDISDTQEKMPDNILHGESEMHDEKSKDDNLLPVNINTLDAGLNEIVSTSNSEPVEVEVSENVQEDEQIENTGSDDKITDQVIDIIPCMKSQTNELESQPACTNVVMETEEIPGESQQNHMHENLIDSQDVLQNQNFTAQSESIPISLEQEHQGSGGPSTNVNADEDEESMDVCVDKTYLDNNQDHVDSLIVDSIPPEFSDEKLTNNETKHSDESKDTSVDNLISDSAINENLVDFSSTKYCLKFPAMGNYDSIVVSSQRPFSVICGKQIVSVNTKSNSLEDLVVCEVLVSASMLSNDLQLANDKMDTLGRSSDAKISVILLERNDNNVPVGLNLSSEKDGNMVVSQLESLGLVHKSGQIKQGDSVLLINGEVVRNDNADAILQSVENSESHLICVVISPDTRIQSNGVHHVEPETAGNLQPNSPSSDENGNKKIVASPDEVDSVSADGLLEITMTKGVTGLGFLIEGGLGSPRGDVPVKIKRMFKGGAATKCGLLKVGDELVTVNGVDMAQMKHTEAWNFLKFLNDGDVKLVIRRISES